MTWLPFALYFAGKLGLNFSGFFAWFLWRGIYLGKMPTLARRVQIAFDWAWQLIFPRDIVQLSRRETERLPREHFEPGEYILRKRDLGNNSTSSSGARRACTWTRLARRWRCSAQAISLASVH